MNSTGILRKASCALAFAIVFLAGLLCLSVTNAHASGLTQTSQTQTSITVSWTPEDNTVSQSAQIATEYSKIGSAATIALSATDSSYTFTGLKAGTSYFVRINYTYTYSSGYTRQSYFSLWDAKTLTSKVTGVKQSKWWYYIKQVDFTWNEQTATDRYQYIVKKASNGKTVQNSTTYGSSNQAGCSVKNNVVYTVKVRACVTINNKDYWGAWSSNAYLFTQPMCTTKTKAVNGKLTIAWGKISGTTGYNVFVSTKEKSGYKKVKSVGKGTSKVTIKKLKGKKIKKSKTYYVYIVAKKKVGSKTYTSGRHYSYKVKGSTGSVRWTFD